MGAAQLMINRTTHGTPGDDNHTLALHFEGQAGGRAAFECSLQSWVSWVIYQCSCDGTDDLSVFVSRAAARGPVGNSLNCINLLSTPSPPPRPPETNAADFAIKTETGKHGGR